ARHHQGRAAGDRVPAILVAKTADVSYAVDLRHAHLRVADQHEAHVMHVASPPPREVLEHLRAVLALDDAADIEEVRTGDAVLLAEPVRITVGRRLDADADDLVRHALVPEAPPHHAALLLGVVGDRAGRKADRLGRGEAGPGLLVRRRR